jgi:hypothetical protein
MAQDKDNPLRVALARYQKLNRELDEGIEKLDTLSPFEQLKLRSELEDKLEELFACGEVLKEMIKKH